MILAAIIPLAAAWILGLGFVATCLRNPARSPALTCLHHALAIGLGLGLTSCGAFLWFTSIGPLNLIYLAVDVALSIVVGLALLIRVHRHSPRPEHLKLVTSTPAIWPVLGLVAAISLTGMTLCAIRNPHGGWDATAIWNVHARFLHRANTPAAAFSPHLWRTHIDYPLLLPASVARMWLITGESTTIPAAIGILFFLLTVVLVAATVAFVCDASLGLLAALAVLSTDILSRHGISQYADTPLAFYIVAALACLILAHRRPFQPIALTALTGAFASLAAWTKHEGFLFLLILATVLSLRLLLDKRASRDPRELFAFVAGAAPALATNIWFKLRWAAPNDLLAAQSWQAIVARAGDVDRYRQVAVHLARTIAAFGSGAAWVLLAAALLIGLSPSRRSIRSLRSACLILALTLASYAMVYILTPQELTWHLRSSSRRLLLQLYPAAVMLLFLSLNSLHVRTPTATTVD